MNFLNSDPFKKKLNYGIEVMPNDIAQSLQFYVFTAQNTKFSLVFTFAASSNIYSNFMFSSSAINN